MQTKQGRKAMNDIHSALLRLDPSGAINIVSLVSLGREHQFHYLSVQIDTNGGGVKSVQFIWHLNA